MENEFVVIEDYQSDNGLSYVEVKGSAFEYLLGRVIVLRGTEKECSDFCSQYSYDNPYELI